MSDIDLDMNERNEVYAYLEDLRMSGVSNMFGAGSYLSEEFGFSKRYAQSWLIYWMQNYGS